MTGFRRTSIPAIASAITHLLWKQNTGGVLLTRVMVRMKHNTEKQSKTKTRNNNRIPGYEDEKLIGPKNSVLVERVTLISLT